MNFGLGNSLFCENWIPCLRHPSCIFNWLSYSYIVGPFMPWMSWSIRPWSILWSRQRWSYFWTCRWGPRGMSIRPCWTWNTTTDQKISWLLGFSFIWCSVELNLNNISLFLLDFEILLFFHVLDWSIDLHQPSWWQLFPFQLKIGNLGGLSGLFSSRLWVFGDSSTRFLISRVLQFILGEISLKIVISGLLDFSLSLYLSIRLNELEPRILNFISARELDDIQLIQHIIDILHVIKWAKFVLILIIQILFFSFNV